MCHEKKAKRASSVFKTVTMHRQKRLEDFIKKHGGRQTSATRKSTEKQVSTKQK